MLAPLALLVGQVMALASPGHADNLSEKIYWESVDASGSRLCDRARANRYQKLFDRRFGERVRALLRYHVSRFGPDPEFVVTSSCRGITRRVPELVQDRDQARAMDRFDAVLHDLEDRFGPSGNER